MHWTVGVALATLYEGRLNKSSIGASDDATTLPLAAWQSRAEERALKGDEGREKRWEQGAGGRGERMSGQLLPLLPAPLPHLLFPLPLLHVSLC